MPHEQERPKRREEGREDDGEHLGEIYDCFVHVEKDSVLYY